MARQYVPTNPLALEHIGSVEAVIHPKVGDTAIILALLDGAKVVAKGNPIPREIAEAGHLLRFSGKWVQNKSYGYQFQFDSYAIHSPGGRRGTVKFLERFATGIGRVTANRLYDLHGADCVRILRESPQILVECGAMSFDIAIAASESLTKVSVRDQVKIKMMDVLSGYGFPDKSIDQLIDWLGAKAPDLININPFLPLFGCIPGFSYNRVSRLFDDLKSKGSTTLRPAKIKRYTLKFWNELETDRTGSSWFDARRTIQSFEDNTPEVYGNPKFFRLARRGGLIRAMRDRQGGAWIATATAAIAESVLAQNLLRLTTATPSKSWPVDSIRQTEVAGDGLPTAHQFTALHSSLACPVGIFAGRPGTGKTHTASWILRAIQERYGLDCVKLVAPTGKAAIRLSESMEARSIPVVATTVHSLLLLDPTEGFDGESKAKIENCNFLIVDESSMCETALLARLLLSVQTGTNVLLIGDPNQLPPIGRGFPLRDLIEIAKRQAIQQARRGEAVVGAIGFSELTEIQRNSGWIVELCSKIADRKRIEPTYYKPIDLDSGRNVQFVAASDPAKIFESIVSIVDRVGTGELSEFDLDDVQVIVPRNDGSKVGRKELNTTLRGRFNTNDEVVVGTDFRIGDRVICSKNSDYRLFVVEDKSAEADEQPATWMAKRQTPELVRVANGEIGKIIASNSNAILIDLGTRCIVCPVAKSKDADEDSSGSVKSWDLAYAVTGHKMQGSQSPVLILVADPNGGPVNNRPWIYTGISRASKVTFIVGDWNVFATMCARDTTVHRKTMLVEVYEQLLERLNGTKSQEGKTGDAGPV